MCLMTCIGAAIDGDNPDHILWICEEAQKRADEFGIQGVNYRLTQGIIITGSPPTQGHWYGPSMCDLL